MNILHIVTEGNVVGGAGVVVQTLSRRMIEDGHNVVVATGPGGKFSRMLIEAGIPWQDIPSMKRDISPGSDIRAVVEIKRLIRSEQPDLVVCHSSKAGVVGRIAAYLESKPNVFTVHGWAFTEGVPQPKRFVYEQLERLMAHLTTRFVCVSEYDRQLALRHGFHAGKIVTVHNGIPDAGVVKVKREPDDVLDVAMVARFNEQKDQATLVRAVAEVPGVRIHFIGDGPTMASVQALARELGIDERCIFHGFREDVDSLLRGCDVFCLTSLYEGFPLTTIEAMRLGLPVIVSDAGGSREAVDEGVTGFVVLRGDHRTVAGHLRALRDDPDLRERMGLASRRKYLDLFTFEKMYANTLAVYRSAAAEGRTRRRSLQRTRGSRVAQPSIPLTR